MGFFSFSCFCTDLFPNTLCRKCKNIAQKRPSPPPSLYAPVHSGLYLIQYSFVLVYFISPACFYSTPFPLLGRGEVNKGQVSDPDLQGEADAARPRLDLWPSHTPPPAARYRLPRLEGPGARGSLPLPPHLYLTYSPWPFNSTGRQDHFLKLTSDMEPIDLKIKVYLHYLGDSLNLTCNMRPFLLNWHGN